MLHKGFVVAKLDMPSASFTLHLCTKYVGVSVPCVVYQWYISSSEEFNSDKNLQGNTISEACKNLTNFAFDNSYILTWITE